MANQFARVWQKRNRDALRAAILVVMLALQGGCTGPGLPQTTESFETLVDRQIDELSTASGFIPSIRFDSDLPTSVSRDGPIIVNISQLRDYTDQAGVRHSDLLVRFILAHEIAHQMQFERLDAEAMEAVPLSMRRVYEAQADILAADMFMATLSARQRRDESIMSEVLDAAHGFGATGLMHPTHPLPESRRNAVQLGMAMYLLDAAGRDGASTVTIGQMRWPIGQLRRVLDYPRRESKWDWSLRAAKLASHYSLDAGVNLEIGEVLIEWDDSWANPTVDYSFTCTNTAERPIKVTFLAEIMSKPREDSRELWMDRINLDRHVQVIEAGETRTFRSKRLRWYVSSGLSAGTSRHMPVLRTPPALDALMSFEYADGGPVQANNEALAQPFHLADVPPSVQSQNLGLVIGIMVNNHVEDRFMRLRTGPGRRRGDYVYWQSLVNLPGATETLITIWDDGLVTLDATVGAEMHEARARQWYNELVEQVGRSHPFIAPKERSRRSSYSDSWYTVFDNVDGRGTDIVVDLDYHKRQDEWEVDVAINHRLRSVNTYDD